ncbi:hypothetical protein COCOBI_03-0510 [Coccomyxa sp. Obi]|nr:hypothetical protein COCOBI_03-0510 [Coccomyxa sp. Obi]
MFESMREPLLSSNTELDGPWEERTLQTELKKLKAYQQIHAKLYAWVKTKFSSLERVAHIYGIDLDELTEESIEKVPDMHPLIRAGFYRALVWYRLAEKISQLLEYQAQQKREKSYGVWPCWRLAQKAFHSNTPTIVSR